jgi:dCMP deaminase
MRMTREEMYAAMAIIVSQRGTCKRAKAGAVLIKDNRIVSMGYNGAPEGLPHCLDVGCLMEGGHCIRTVHAEANLIAFAAREGIPTKGCTIYVTFEPCLTCAKLIINAGIRRVVVLGERGAYPGSAAGVALLDQSSVILDYQHIDDILVVPYNVPGT